MKLKKILKHVPIHAIRGIKEVEITGITANSKLAAPGNLFIAKRGRSHDGSRFIAEALLAGISAVVTDLYDPFLSGVTQVIHPDPAEIEPLIATNYYQNPSDKLFLVGVTGTNGKTTSSYLIKHLLDDSGVFCGLIGTIEYIIGKQHLPAELTTPDLLTAYKLLYEITMSRYPAAVMEVSSHALDQNRLQGIEFDVALYTNLSHDHLDYHQNMDAYLQAKCRLFSTLKKGRKRGEKKALINMDDPYAQKVIQACTSEVITYGIENTAEIRASEIILSKDRTEFILHYHGQKVKIQSPLIGRFNVYNVLGAIGVALQKGIELGECQEALLNFAGIPGRLEKVKNKLGLTIFVDYAHTEDALKNVLTTLKEIKKGKIFTVFGCGGSRDAAKRPKMAQAAEALSDHVIITSDNPRQEDPQKICSEIEAGFSNDQKYFVEVDRRKAIERAIEMAQKEDIVLIAGKGHEGYQMFSNITVAFDDREVAKAACQNLITQRT
ncbi:MAG: UDP-N-acetylmuramoyl-L-alanyl-D-glutamate--2,6-diaminopimelate ligase [Simkaniaceae bacterium]